MASETKTPDGLLTSTNLTGGLSAIDTDDTTFLVASSNNADSVVAVSFPTPSGNPDTGVDVQSFTVKYRVTANANSVTFNAYLRESGTRLNGGTAIDTWSSTSTTEVTREIGWNASLLGTSDGSLVELEVVATKTGGSPTNRTTGEFQFIDWDIVFSAAPITGTGSISLGSVLLSGTGIRETVGVGSMSIPSLTVSSTGIRGSVGNGDLSLASIALDSTGIRNVTGSGSIGISAIAVTGDGVVGAIITGTGLLNLPSLVMDSSGIRGVNSTGDILLPSIEITSTGIRGSVGSSNLLLPLFSVTGLTSITRVGTASLFLPLLTINGIGTGPVSNERLEGSLSGLLKGYLLDRGHTGALNDALRSAYSAETGLSEGTLNDLMMKYFIQQGILDGTIDDRMMEFLKINYASFEGTVTDRLHLILKTNKFFI